MSKLLYISIDVEADGPIPGRYSMLQFGAAAFDLDDDFPREPIATFRANLDLLPEAGQSADTMAWWATQGDAYDKTRIDARDAYIVMPEFLTGLRALPGKPTIVGYPVTYDFNFLYWYTMAFGGLADGERCPFGFQGLDIKTLAAHKLGIPFRSVGKRRMPKHWFDGAPRHTHDGLDDAIGQGVLFVNMMRENP